MDVRTLTLTSYQSNCYVVRSEGASLIVDPGAMDPGIREAVADTDVVGIATTHAHPDHIAGTPELVREIDAPVWLHRDDWPMWQSLLGSDVAPDRFLAEGDALEVGALRWEVWHTPGHSPGHVVLLERTQKAVLAGDLIFSGSVGRTDLPGGSDTQLGDSLRRLDTLTGDWTLYPGHGPVTTLEQERRLNPFLRELG